jgi:hypothetical protein
MVCLNSSSLFFAFLHPITVGVNHEPMKAVTTTVNNVTAYSGGIGGGSADLSTGQCVPD